MYAITKQVISQKTIDYEYRTYRLWENGSRN
jgi:hypothetical protein